MKSLSTMCRIGALLSLFFFLPAVSQVQAASGFSMSFEPLDSWVSSYKEPEDRRSVSLGNPVYPHVSGELNRRPELVEASSDSSTFRFQTKYHRRGGEVKSLTPVSVDAYSFNQYRRRKHVQESWEQIATKQLDQARQARQQGGLGVSINLPKRLDKIFGEGGAGLRVSGYRRIMFSGRSQWTDATSVTVKQSKFPSLNMEQMYQFDITGTIGSKITVKVAQDSHTDMPLSNSIQIRYKGDDDEILKTIEAGNTNLSLPNTQFVGYSSNIRGLFGVKAEAQLGRLTLTGIASQEKGSSERTTITPTGEESAQIVRDFDYAERRVFDLGDAAAFAPGDAVERIFVYQEMEQLRDARPSDAVYSIMYVEPDRPLENTTENVNLAENLEKGAVPIEPTDYDLFSHADSRQHYIVFFRQPRQLSIGVYMEIKRANGTIDTIGVNGQGTTSDPKILKLVYNSHAVPSYKTWNYMWRNVYAINPGTQIEDIDIKIYKGLVGTENTTSPKDYQEGTGGQQKYLEILGLDQYNAAGSSRIPDGKLDELPAVFRSDWGLVIFPSRTPFYSDTTFQNAQGQQTQVLDPKVPEIYFFESGTEKSQSSQYFMKFFTKSRSTEIRLGRPNVIEGSERVTANGVTLERNVDYRVDYDFGRVTLMSERATDPNADIDIDFEYAPFLSIQKKTLFGMRAEYEVSRDLKVGSTILYKSDKARDRKPRVGEETAKSFVFDVDASWSLQPNFLTRLANALPILQTEVPSNLKLSGEVAQSRPNPNVEGEAYVDDFEASAEQLTLGTGRTQWHKSSKPYQLGGLSRRSKLLWHNPIELLQVKEVYNKDTEAGESTFRSMRLIFRPSSVDTTGWEWQPNPNNANDSIPVPQVADTTAAADSWAGMMRYFAGRIDKERVQLFELRARASSGRMHIEFGRISEDVDGNGKGFSEDLLPTGKFEEYEDVGLDSLSDGAEPFYHPIYNPDPNHDNWYFEGEGKCPLPANLCNDPNIWNNDSTYYEYLNGTEGNRNDYEYLNEPDKEILGNSFQRENGYFSYVIDFDANTPSPFRVDSSMFPSKQVDPNKPPPPPWYTYRIPIRDTAFLDDVIVEGGNTAALQPEWSGERITHIRIWFEERPGQTAPDTVEIADWYFVQSQWRDTVIYGLDSPRKSKLVAATVSEDDGTFRPPPGVQAYEDPTTNVTEAQRGLELRFDSLDYRDIAEARKSVLSVDKYSGYRRLAMYVHTELDSNSTTADYSKMMFYFRIGRDSLNFYEQRRVFQPGDWAPENYIDIDFNKITAIKDAAQRDRERAQWTKVDTVSPDGRERVKGDPSLNEIKYFAAGVINLDSTGIRTPSGHVWLDELRVADVRRDVGTAARFSASGNIADLGNYSFNYQSQDPYFRGLSSSTRGGSDQNLGSGSSDTRLSYSMSLNLDKFLPRSWSARLPVSYTYSKNTRLPLLRTGSDIVLPEEVRRIEQEVSESKMLSVSASFNKPGRNPLFSLLLNRLQNTSFSYRRSLQQSPRTPYGLSEGYNIRSGFNFGLTKPPSVSPLTWLKSIPILKRVSETRVGLYPSRWTTTFGYDRTLSITDDIDGNRRSSFQRMLDGQMDFAYDVFQNLALSLRLDTRRDLSNDEDVSLSLSNLKLGLETRFAQQFSLSYKPGLVKWLSTDFGFTGSYSDDYERSTKSRRSTMSSSWSVNGRFDHMALFGGRGSGTDRRGLNARAEASRKRAERGAKTAEKKTERPFYDPPLAVLRFLTGWIEAPSYNYSETFRYSLPGSLERPRLIYRLGLSRSPNIETVSGTTNPNATEGISYDFGTGFNFLGGFQTSVKFRRSIGRDVVKRGDLYEDISTSWPDLSIQIRPFDRLPLIKGVVNKFIEIFAPRTGYSRATRERRDLGADRLISKSVSTSQNPVLSLNFKLFRSLSLTSSYGLTKDENQEYNRTTGDFQSRSESVRKTIGGSMQYSFSAPGGINMPLFGKLKFRSTINLSLDVKYNMSTNSTWDAANVLTSSTEKDEIEIRPDISYTFSQQIKGGLSMRWRDSDTSDRTTHLREVQIWMEIRF